MTGTQGSGIPAGIGADSRKFRPWTGIPGIRDCRRLFRSRGTPGVHGTPENKNLGLTGNGRDFDPWELSEVVEVNVKKKKRSRCMLCGEKWLDIGPSFILEHMGFEPGREVQKKYARCA